MTVDGAARREPPVRTPPREDAARFFARLGREARGWMAAPASEKLAVVVLQAQEVSLAVPASRRRDWDKLVAGFALAESDDKRRARVEGLVRACRLFEREERARQRRARPLAWSDPVEEADGLGPAAHEHLSKVGVSYVADLVWTLPLGWDDLRAPVTVEQAIQRARAAAAALEPAPRQVVRAWVRGGRLVPMKGRRVVRVVLGAEGSGGGTIEAWWFYVAHGILQTAKPGTECLILGRVRTGEDGKRPRVAHPELIVAGEGAAAGEIRARYPSLGVPAANLRRAIRDAVVRASPLPDPVPPEISSRENMPPAEPLLRAVHDGCGSPAPDRADPPIELLRALAERLAWVEAFAIVWQRLRREGLGGAARAPVMASWDGALAARLEAELGFVLTGAQRRAIEAVAADLKAPTPMRRLLLGDVGTGKTAVALAAAAQCVASGYQAALLAPTSVLADQYRSAAGPLERATGARVVFVASSTRAGERRKAIEALARGTADVAVGTHALLEGEVAFARLGLVVVDEQQRFGVAQRLSLVRKGQEGRPHLLSLSATPIPRTMALALRGELAMTVLDERPQGRLPVATELVPRRELPRVIAEVREACARGERAFFVCPRIEDDDTDGDELGATALAEHLASELAGVGVTVVHGAMTAARRTEAMGAFRRGDAQVLVGTTVVEVGVDVPEATVMVVDGAERYGLSQLHQLRGRVGRGMRPGRCVLLHDEPLVDLARRRLEVLVATTDGAAVARADLALRGSGDLGGVRQSGEAEELRWLDPSAPPAWVERIDGDVRSVVARDPDLRAPEHLALALAVRRVVTALAVREEAG